MTPEDRERLERAHSHMITALREAAACRLDFETIAVELGADDALSGLDPIGDAAQACYWQEAEDRQQVEDGTDESPWDDPGIVVVAGPRPPEWVPHLLYDAALIAVQHGWNRATFESFVDEAWDEASDDHHKAEQVQP